MSCLVVKFSAHRTVMPPFWSMKTNSMSDTHVPLKKFGVNCDELTELMEKSVPFTLGPSSRGISIMMAHRISPRTATMTRRAIRIPLQLR